MFDNFAKGDYIDTYDNKLNLHDNDSLITY